MNAFTLDHLVLEVQDPVRSVRFYADVLGLVPVRLEEFAAGRCLFPSVRIDEGCVIDFFPPSMWRGAAPVNPNHFCLTGSAEQRRALEDRLAAAGIPVLRRDDHNFGARGFGKALYFTDPDGITVEARHYEP